MRKTIQELLAASNLSVREENMGEVTPILNTLTTELNDEEVTEFLISISESEIYCDQDYIFCYLNNTTIFQSLQAFIEDGCPGSYVFTLLSSGKVVQSY